MIEIRIPTYKRPDLLNRALQSLIEQNFQNWKAIVLDDSPNGEGKEIVDKLNDDRLTYRQNQKNLGGAKNLNLSFSSKPFFPESLFACVLEDDNYYKSNFLANAISYLKSGEYEVFLGNAQIAQYYEEGKEIIQERYTLSPIYGNEIREIDYLERLKNVPFNTVVGNLCLVWSLNSDINFEVEQEKYNAVVQEKMRGLLCKKTFIYDPTPNAIFTNFPQRTWSNKNKILYRRFRRSKIALTRFWYKELKKHGIDDKELPEQNKIRTQLLEAIIINSNNLPLTLYELKFILKSLFLYLRFPFQSRFSKKV